MPVVAKLYDGDVIIETRDAHTPALRVRFRSKQANRKWERRALGTDDLEVAKEKARELYHNYKARVDAGIPTGLERKFKDVAIAYRDQLQQWQDEGIGLPIHKSYISIINKWIVPILGKKSLTQIDEAAIAYYDTERKLAYKTEIPKSTIGQHNVALRAILDYAAGKKYINRSDIPKFTLKNKGRKAERRPRFSTEEIVTLFDHLKRWELEANTAASIYKRQLLRCYVEFIYYTGCRPGREMNELRWRDIERTDTKVRVNFRETKAEGHKRRITADSRLHVTLERLEVLTNPASLDEYLFRMFTGKQVTGLSELFSNALTEFGMRLTSDGQPRTLYSLRHSYASEKIVESTISREMLARQMGTSWSMLEQYYVELHDELYVEEFSQGDIDIYDQAQAAQDLRDAMEHSKDEKETDQPKRLKDLMGQFDKRVLK